MTSIEWLTHRIHDLEYAQMLNKIESEEYGKLYREFIEQAKEMHKQEIINTYSDILKTYNKVKSLTKYHQEEAVKYYQTKFNSQDGTDK